MNLYRVGPGLLLLCWSVGCGGDDTQSGPEMAGTAAGMEAGTGAGEGGAGAGAGEGGAGESAGTGTAGTTTTGTGERVPFTPGEPVDAPAMEWTYVATAGAVCQDGSETGFGINPNPASDKLLIYMEGGGACFNSTTCLLNPQNWGGQAALDAAPPGGILSRAGSSPFADWNMVYLPYCSGDVFSGTRGMGDGYMGRAQQGYINVGLFLERTVPTFADVSEVVLAGVSAGGFGAAWNGLRTQDAFGDDIPVHELDDSGPPMGAELMPPCQQKKLTEIWGWEDSVYPDCPGCDLEAGAVTEPLADVAFAREGTSRFGILSNDEDGVIKLFLSFAREDCSSWDAASAPAVPEGLYPEGLADIRERSAGSDRFAMFQVTGMGHTFLAGNLSAVQSAGVSLLDWVTAFRDGTADFVNVVP